MGRVRIIQWFFPRVSSANHMSGRSYLEPFHLQTYWTWDGGTEEGDFDVMRGDEWVMMKNPCMHKCVLSTLGIVASLNCSLSRYNSLWEWKMEHPSNQTFLFICGSPWVVLWNSWLCDEGLLCHVPLDVGTYLSQSMQITKWWRMFMLILGRPGFGQLFGLTANLGESGFFFLEKHGACIFYHHNYVLPRCWISGTLGIGKQLLGIKR